MKKFDAPSVRELLDTGAEKFGDATFIKFIRDGKIEVLPFRPAVYFFALRALVFPLAPALLGLIIQPLSITRIIHPV